MDNTVKIVDMEYHPHSEDAEIPESDGMGISLGVDVNIAILIIKFAVVLGIIAIGMVLYQSIFP
ncbi:MAG: hypothetical protein UV71_C0012G0011 [Microgenomates group bacterium GW2011_GWC1_43_13]|uniref:Uncharacterized protein n=3 Tax=Candidatus Woeseibacteriota TaxID=1752722 RepID=A0A837IDV1_9BACT|nr:MAG: hypothetical protein UV71_C0012G0011 [Microgenomates group bacterium GW2011_GWC1_43_13]KKT33089.1 MAG: hypothetical protein UW20_C0005G0021 [Candidatus Woesebacteria bacterium GW2011_GWB1_44_11]KKT54751.1 MAG: hypothetical protein UW47_C0003G0020 [Candidatus Woesebacteria bacterium GW2011_GWA1_44_23]OGM76340.1 MAG: hypothetical protein A2208_01170 [Candidatus Woesebacteria bacterium RIFOXYA1_FULL_43_16]OGM81527.1 MAG: hypothetical protein A2394_01020 [Candidatus Woesebacteria bacterium 